MDFQIKGRREKKNTQYSMQGIYANFRIRSHNSPLRRKSPRACSRYQPEGKNPQIATKEERTTCTGTESKTSQLVSRMGRKFQKQEFQVSRKKNNTKTKAAVISAPLEMVRWSKPPSEDVTHLDKTLQTRVGST